MKETGKFSLEKRRFKIKLSEKRFSDRKQKRKSMGEGMKCELNQNGWRLASEFALYTARTCI